MAPLCDVWVKWALGFPKVKKAAESGPLIFWALLWLRVWSSLGVWSGRSKAGHPARRGLPPPSGILVIPGIHCGGQDCGTRLLVGAQMSVTRPLLRWIIDQIQLGSQWSRRAERWFSFASELYLLHTPSPPDRKVQSGAEWPITPPYGTAFALVSLFLNDIH